MMRRFGIQNMKLCKTNLILRLRIWLIQSDHDKVNLKYSYIFQKWPVTYQFCVYVCFCIITLSKNLTSAYLSLLFKDDSLGSALGNVIISSPFLYIVMQQSMSLSLLDSIFRKKLLNLLFKYTITLLTVLAVIILTANIRKLNRKI